MEVTKTIKQPYALHWARTSIRSTATLFYFLGIILLIADGARCVSEINRYNSEQDYEIDSSVCWTDGSAGDLRPLLVALVAVIWNLAEFITLCVNKRGIHPGANLGMDIILWLDSMLNIIFSFLLLDGFTGDGMYLGALSLILLASILQFVLFILDCIAVHKWRRTRYGYPMGYQPGVYQQTMPVGAIPVQQQPQFLPQAQPGFVYVQVPAGAVTTQGMAPAPMFDMRQSVMGVPMQEQQVPIPAASPVHHHHAE